MPTGPKAIAPGVKLMKKCRRGGLDGMNEVKRESKRPEGGGKKLLRLREGSRGSVASDGLYHKGYERSTSCGPDDLPAGMSD